jgi:hypothetical protein
MAMAPKKARITRTNSLLSAKILEKSSALRRPVQNGIMLTMALPTNGTK